MNLFHRQKEPEGGIVRKEDMQGLTRRHFMGLAAASVGAAIIGLPFEADAQNDELITVRVTSIDETRESFGAIVENYCDPNLLTKFYGTSSFASALEKLARFNGLRPPQYIVQENEEIRIPRVLLKDSLRKKIKKTTEKWPLKLQGDMVIVTAARDRERNSLLGIIEHYIDGETLLRYYGTTSKMEAMEKLARFNGLRPPYTIQLGQKIKFPHLITKADIWRDYDKVDDRIHEEHEARDKTKETSRRAAFQSPFSGVRKPVAHRCFDTAQNAGAGVRRICPFDTYKARRGGGWRHHALDVYCTPGTPLYPLKPGVVIGAGYEYLASSGKKQRFPFYKNNGLAVKIQSGDYVYMYIHMKRVFMKIGQRVDYQTCVGESGITGNASAENPHVHITMAYRGGLVDPLRFLSFLK